MQVWCFNNIYVFSFLIIVQDLLLIGVGAMKLMTMGMCKFQVQKTLT
jgi:hypothetical protein